MLLVAIDTQHLDSHKRLSWKESCLEINVKNVPTLAGCNLATHPGLVQTGESVC